MLYSQSDALSIRRLRHFRGDVSVICKHKGQPLRARTSFQARLQKRTVSIMDVADSILYALWGPDRDRAINVTTCVRQMLAAGGTVSASIPGLSLVCLALARKSELQQQLSTISFFSHARLQRAMHESRSSIRADNEDHGVEASRRDDETWG